MILAKRDGFREVFSNWEIGAIAAMGPGDVDALRQNTGIVRNRLKIQATIENARTVQKPQAENGSFCAWFYHILPGTTHPTLQKGLRRTFSFMGLELSRMWLIASGRITREEGDKYRP